MIGTPPNIVIATFRGEALGDPYTMFDFAPVGLVVAAVGIAYVALIGWRLIPVERTSASMPSSIEDLESYLVELRVPAEAEVIGQKLRQLDSQANEAGVQILGLVRRRRAAAGHGGARHLTSRGPHCGRGRTRWYRGFCGHGGAQLRRLRPALQRPCRARP